MDLGNIHSLLGKNEQLYILTALHLWFVFSGWRDMNGNHVVAWRHIILTSVGHLLLGNNTIDLWKMRKSPWLCACRATSESKHLGKPRIAESKDFPYFCNDKHSSFHKKFKWDVFCIYKLKYKLSLQNTFLSQKQLKKNSSWFSVKVQNPPCMPSIPSGCSRGSQKSVLVQISFRTAEETDCRQRYPSRNQRAQVKLLCLSYHRQVHACTESFARFLGFVCGQ